MSLLRLRATQAVENMDLSDCDPRRLERTYHQFGAVNRLFAGWRGLYIRELRPLLFANQACTVLDIGSGGGDLAMMLAKWAAHDRLELAITGIDPDSRAHAFASNRQKVAGVHFRQAHSADLVREGRHYDVVISNHVLHHLKPVELTSLLADSQMLAARLCLHNDLRRSPAAYALFSIAALPFTGSFIRSDGLTSIRRSFTPAELAVLAPPGWRVQLHYPFHQLLVRAGAAND